MISNEPEFRSIEVLLVEDSPGDVRLTQEAFRDANSEVNLHVVRQTVPRQWLFSDVRGTTLMPRGRISSCLDLNLPKMDGREVLTHIKDDGEFDDDPHRHPDYLARGSGYSEKAINSGANCYLTKPVQLSEFETLVRSINDFWMTKVMLPPKRRAGDGKTGNLSRKTCTGKFSWSKTAPAMSG